MATGSITVTNKSNAIQGSGTAFTMELARGDFIVFNVGNVTYTLAVSTVKDDENLTVAKSYTGPSADSVPFMVVPFGTSSLVTTELVAQITEAMRGLNNDKANWSEVFSSKDNITLVMPDGSEFSGPSWGKIVEAVKDAGGDELMAAVDAIHADTETVTAAQADVLANKEAAAASEANAKTSETNAAASEKSAAESAASTAADAKSTAADAKATAADAAAADAAATAAATSEANAATSETNAATSAESAAADAAATSADAKATAADAESTAADAAAAAASAKAAAASETNAATSETNAATSEANAKESAASAKEDADRAEAANPEKCLRISQNLADLADKKEAVKNLLDGEPLTLAADAAGNYDAVTLRQLTAATSAGGTGGPTMNGVMNNSLGCVEWFNGTRAKMWPGYVPADGQCLSRAQYPEIWAAVKAGLFVSFDEADWQALAENDNNYSRRAGYSNGGEAGTCPDESITDAWFRVPDLNGSLVGSYPNAYLRGSSTGNPHVGFVHPDGAPAITGQFTGTMDGFAHLPFGSYAGAFTEIETVGNALATISAGQYTTGSHTRGAKFDASRSYAGYGRSPTEIRPTSAIGIWIIRVKGIFSAADTAFNVINADDVMPDAGTTVYGGAVSSAYQVAGKDQLVARLRAKYSVGGDHSAVIEIVDSSGAAVTTDTIQLFKTGILLWEAAGTGSNNNRNGGNYRSETAQSWGQWRAYRNDADGGIVFETAQDGGATQRFWMTGQGKLVIPGSFSALNGDLTANIDAPANVNIGDYLNAPSVRSRLVGRGAYGDGAGAFVGLYHQEWVGNYAQGILNLNGYGSDRNWFFRQTGEMAGPNGTIQAAGSDVRLKTNINPATDGAGDRIDQIGVVEFEWLGSGKKERGFIAQQMDTIDELYTELNGEGTDENGEKFDVLNVKDRAVMADLIVCVQELRQQVAELQKELAALKKKA